MFKYVLCRSEIIDISDTVYLSGEIIEKAYEEPFSIKDKSSYNSRHCSLHNNAFKYALASLRRS